MKAALIGAGQIARQHLACLKETPGIEVAAVCDLSPSVAESAAERFADPAWFTDHRAMLARFGPTWCTSPHLPPRTSSSRWTRSRPERTSSWRNRPPTTLDELESSGAPRRADRALVEDYNYLFNRAPQEILRRIETGEFGAVVHVEVLICLDILGPAGFADPNAPHPASPWRAAPSPTSCPTSRRWPTSSWDRTGGASTVVDQAKPTVLPYDEFRAVVEAERGTASLCFSA